MLTGTLTRREAVIGEPRSAGTDGVPRPAEHMNWSQFGSNALQCIAPNPWRFVIVFWMAMNKLNHAGVGEMGTNLLQLVVDFVGPTRTRMGVPKHVFDVVALLGICPIVDRGGKFIQSPLVTFGSDLTKRN